ncbi:hypothetical protein RRG08_019882 [Elysia crispata]|uniref:Uncharacterized protein n=1 Tax=Elysia crispata TaxID=231223 RepID=A0AAE0Z8N7_9GAST|nr:hypothetical protein RRG08_019882 [Elysia crispata]
MTAVMKSILSSFSCYISVVKDLLGKFESADGIRQFQEGWNCFSLHPALLEGTYSNAIVHPQFRIQLVQPFSRCTKRSEEIVAQSLAQVHENGTGGGKKEEEEGKEGPRTSLQMTGWRTSRVFLIDLVDIEEQIGARPPTQPSRRFPQPREETLKSTDLNIPGLMTDQRTN